MLEKDNTKKEFILSKSVWIMDKYNFFEYIAVMLDWWVWITESLNSVHSKITSPYFKQKIKELVTFINSWDSFSRAMRKIPDIFSNAEVFMIEAWEATGQLSHSLNKLSEDLKKTYELRKKIKWALTYPTIIFLFMFLAIAIVLTYVVPSIKPLFEWSDKELPFATQSLLWVSDFIVNRIDLIIILVVSVVFWVYFYFKWTKSGQENLEKMMLSAPLIWKVYRNYILANVASTFWNLVWSWVSIIKSLELTWKATNSSIYEKVFEDIKEKVSTWNWIVKSMEDSDPLQIYFPADYLQMLSVWERTANIEEISIKLNKQYEKEVEYSLASLTKWIEPIAILFAWIFVMWFVFGIFSAIMQVTETVA